MQNNINFNKDELKSLIRELSDKYNIDELEVDECVKDSLAKAYNYERIIINDNGSITGLKKNKNNINYDLVQHNISKDIYKNFKFILSSAFFSKSFLRIEDHFTNLIKTSDNIFYGKITEYTNNQIVFKLYDSNNNELKNFYAVMKNSKRYLFENETKNSLYKQINAGMLLYIPKREKIKINNGIFTIRAVRKHERIIRFKINSIFKNLRKMLGVSYGYDKCFINTNTKTITIFLNFYFSPAAKQYFEKSILELDEFKIIYINAYKRRVK